MSAGTVYVRWSGAVDEYRDVPEIEAVQVHDNGTLLVPTSDGGVMYAAGKWERVSATAGGDGS